MPLSENAYLLLSMGALLLASRAVLLPTRSAWLWWVTAVLVALAACRVRTVGVTLVAAIVAVAMIRPAVWCLATKRRRLIATLAAILLLVGGIAVVWPWLQAASAPSSSPSYLAQARMGRENGWLPYLWFSFGSHLRELGEISLNLPALRFPVLTPLFWIAGAVALAVFLAGFPRLVRQFPVLAAYAGFYSALILFWPFYDPRFWMPLLPVMLLSGWLALERGLSNAALRGVVTAWVAVFLLLGLGAQALSIRMSLAGPRFPTLYGDGTTRDTYRVAFGQIPAAEAAAIDERVLRLLRRFEPRAREATPALPP